MDPVRSLRIRSMTWGMRSLLGSLPFWKYLQSRRRQPLYLGYKRFSLLGAMVTAVILMTGSVLVILENITKIFHPQPVNDEGILWLGIIAVSINVLASLVIRKGQTKNESILSLHFLEDTLGWVAVILMAIVLRFTDWYILDPLLSLAISIFILSKAIPRFLEHAQDFSRCCARRSRYPASEE